MVSRNKLTMCRLCLCENECFINIFERNDWQGYVAAAVISDLLRFQVSETDGYPHVVCLTCLTKLTDFRVFKECCQKSKVKYYNMFVSSESLEERKPEMVEFVESKAGPIYFSENKDTVSKDICDDGLESSEQDPLRETSSDPIIKQEILDIDSTSHDEPEESLEGTNTKEKLIESVSSGNVSAIELAGMSMEDSTQEEEGRKGTAPQKGIVIGFKCYCCGKVLETKEGLKTHLAAHGLGTHLKWNEEKTNTLISLRKKYHSLFTGRRGSASAAYGKIDLEMGHIGVAMVKKKWENLVDKYKRCKYLKIGVGTEDGDFGPISWKYYQAMDEVLGMRHSINPPTITDSGNHTISFQSPSQSPISFDTTDPPTPMSLPSSIPSPSPSSCTLPSFSSSNPSPLLSTSSSSLESRQKRRRTGLHGDIDELRDLLRESDERADHQRTEIITMQKEMMQTFCNFANKFD